MQGPMTARKELIAMLERALSDVACIQTEAGSEAARQRVEAMELLSQAIATLNDPQSLLIDGPRPEAELRPGESRAGEYP